VLTYGAHLVGLWVPDRDGRLDNVVVSLRDVTTAVREAAALERARDRFRRAFHGAPTGMTLATQATAFGRIGNLASGTVTIAQTGAAVLSSVVIKGDLSLTSSGAITQASGGARQAVGHDGKRTQGAASSARGHRSQTKLHLHLWEEVHCHKAVGHIRTLSCHSCAAPHVTLANLNQATAPAQQRQGGAHHAGRGEGVEHHVSAAGRHGQVAGKAGVAAAGCIGHAVQAPQQAALGGAAGAAQGVRPQGSGLLQASQTHAARGGLQQHALAADQTSHLLQGGAGGDEHGGHAGGLLAGQAVGDCHHGV
jgi:hypothetical protein